ncbi:bifunctional phosphopantothenoylcysteine decarboxylase/phosphopantothenate synthase [Alteriqipengyuania flavescens]|uniref:bifunctional phosphopantothenoylcysteine decarboxylase/phosphopantothenate synthase n=1 Tax=Alteriqipengyuania flavescens TaxID=3053610 RepID=UPI0025B4F959|nr:bifunctional phosphopantothenoylcysteine decarboxylase/phosphopantothenate synthase [Alteriqipengyuania flavescens]WJY17456.1 bifunctional phosphopantothenoylcysteine decarboxylase/phosphopantothenate synthase [Alteriqipengyuania flavescens]WJY23399.1 bifunctional phosphopantothenoylcysteine decarboxylase/phosphopantothenate synthase [Alteriqipengyuania flavescens]
MARVLLVVGGGIAAYKSCELVRLIRKGGGEVTCVVTEGGQQFVTPMALAALSENQVYTSLWDLKNEAEMGHIQLSREADLVVVCPATADMLAKMAAGIADDLATTLILATDKPVMAVPAMNVRMWQHEATQRNVGWLRQAGVDVIDPDEGAMACGEYGPGRLPEPEMIWLSIAEKLGLNPGDAGPADIAALQSEALEPESFEEADEHYDEEPEERRRSGLGGLLASIIPRSVPRKIEPEEVAYQDYNGPDEEEEDLPPVEEEDIPFNPDAGGGLLASKGVAKAAPPTDPQEIARQLGLDRAAPEPMEGEAEGAFASVHQAPPADPLAGQPAFEIDPEHRPLFDRHVLITAGPTWEPIDPVRYIANRSSGRQGYAIAAAAAALGARVTLVSGPVHLQTPPGVDRIDVESAEEMAREVKAALPADAAVMVAAVADWRPKDYTGHKIKKRGAAPPALMLTENPDILTSVAASPQRPKLVVGFAAETDDLIQNAQKKRKSKTADWIVANDVSGDVMGGDNNTVRLVSEDGVEEWDTMPKEEVALALAERIADALDERDARDD